MNEEIIIIQDEKVQEIDTIKESVKYIEPITQEKTVIPTKQQQEVIADNGFTSLSKVVVESIPNNYQEVKGEVLLKTNGVHNVAPYETAKVEFEVKLEERSASAVVSGDLVVEPNEGYDGLSKVVINKVTANIDPQIKEENIRKGINILGVTGTYEGSPMLQEKTITPSDKQQNVFPDSEYDGLSKVVVEPISSDYVKPSGTMTITENGTYDVKKYASVVAEIQGSGGSEQTYFSTLNKTGSSSSPGILKSLIDVPSSLQITVGKYQFYGCSSLTRVPLLNYSNLTDCTNMFRACTSITDTSGAKNFKKITNASSMFQECKFQTIDMSSWNVANLTNIKYMFNENSNLVSIDISNWNSSNDIDMTRTFYNCKKLTSIKADNTIITGRLMPDNMFYGCSSLIELDLSWMHNTGGGYSPGMFNGCSRLQKLDIRNFDISAITSSSSYSKMFNSVPTTCEIIVMNDACKTWMNEKFPTMTNVKTVAELG